MAELVELLGTTLEGADGEVATEEALGGKAAVGLYFCQRENEECATFSASLAAAGEALQEKGLAVVLLAADESEEASKAHREDLPWALAQPFASKELRDGLLKRFELEEAKPPLLVIVDAAGAVLTKEGVAKVAEDPGGEAFPWAEPEGPQPLDETELLKRMGPMPPDPGFPDVKQAMVNFKNYFAMGLVDVPEKTEGVFFCHYQCKPYVRCERQPIVDELRKIGFASQWYDRRNDVDKLTGEFVLLLLDPDRSYGDKFCMPVTDKAYEREWERVTARRAEIEEAHLADEMKRLAAAASGGGGGGGEDGADEDCIAPVEDLPRIPGDWKSDSMEQTHTEVSAFTVQSSRSLMQVMISRPRAKFGAPCKISDSGELMQPHCRPQKDPNFILQRKELEIGIQAVKELRTSSSQTTWHRPVNKSTQYQSEDFKRAEEGDEQVDALSAFLSGVSVAVEEALQTNETVDIFQEEFAHLGDEDLGAVSETASNIKEYRNFVDVTYTKGKRIEWVEWVPRSIDMLACSCCDVMPFSERMENAGKATTSTILIWYFYEQLNPHCILQSPWEVPVFKFYPPRSGSGNEAFGWYLLGGLSSGQLIVWKLTGADLGHGPRESSRAREKTNNEDSSRASAVPIQCKAQSTIDESHRRPVLAIEWLPAIVGRCSGAVAEPSSSLTRAYRMPDLVVSQAY